MQSDRRRLLVLVGALSLARKATAIEQVDAPNFIQVNPLLATSGQPSVAALRSIGTQGYQAVIYLAPSSVPNAVQSEPELLAMQDVAFIHIPIEFSAPNESHFQAFSAAMAKLSGRKVLVHCEINMRASSLVFLHRVINLHESPAAAYESVAQVWSPRGAWRRLIVEQLAKHQIQFEPY